MQQQQQWRKLSGQIIEGLIEDEIRYSRIESLSSKASELVTEIMKLAKNREADLK